MKLITFLLFSLIVSSCFALDKYSDSTFQLGVDLANDKNALVVFTAGPFCGICVKMDKEVWLNEKILNGTDFLDVSRYYFDVTGNNSNGIRDIMDKLGINNSAFPTWVLVKEGLQEHKSGWTNVDGVIQSMKDLFLND